MKAILHLCERSLKLKIDVEQDDIASVDKNIEKGAIYDEENEDDNLLEAFEGDSDDDEDVYEESEDDQLYDTMFDNVDEIILVKERLENL